MTGYFIFVTDSKARIAIENYPAAIDAAPYDRITTKCFSGKTVSQHSARQVVAQYGGELISRPGA